MATEATGELRPLANGRWEARIRIEKKQRLGFALSPAAAPDETAALARCKAMAGIAVQLRRAGQTADAPELLTMAARARPGRPWEAVLTSVQALCTEGGTVAISGETIPTFGELLRQWTSGELAKKYPHHVRAKRSAEDDRLRASKHILPIIGDQLVDDRGITLDHAELVMASLPESASAGTRRQVAQIVRRVLSLAVYPCRFRKDNAIPKNWLPRGKSTKAKECLYPDEDLQLLGCTNIPILRRLFYGFACREGMRCSEIGSLDWGDVDTKRGKISLDTNKTDDPRSWSLDAGVLGALNAWKAYAHAESDPSVKVFSENGVPLNVDRIAEVFRRDLRKAGITRAELYERSTSRMPIRVHDLRAGFVTMSLANGKTETWIADRTGHRSSGQIMGYRRRARTWEGLALGSFADLRYAVPEFRSLPHGVPQKHLARVAELADAPDLGFAGASHETPKPLENRGEPIATEPEIGRHGADVGHSEGQHHDPVEVALADALARAAAAGRFDVVGQLAKELEARRLAAVRVAPVVDIVTRRPRS